ncbi:MAG: hypothetical protein Edafosvirus21_20 [Edafosvirus sp.]|uniref:Uncharacterized protein n=1 Tax=Edafosvirus sp. TaxID=2487765 RepID=A0A3G4ZXA9_9VIRU|nr:MAG: hypothetical protein Edafosvirus21_20 [Edafosvirus sp.]
MSSLHKALQSLNYKKAIKLMDECDLDIQDNKGYTALMIAIINTTAKVCGRNVNRSELKKSIDEIINKLIDKKCNVDLQEKEKGNTALIWSIKARLSKITKRIIQTSKNLDLQNMNGETALFYAMCYKQGDIVITIIDEHIRKNNVCFLEAGSEVVKAEVMKYMYKSNIINDIWNLYEKQILEIINDTKSQNPLAISFENQLGDLNVVNILVHYIY